MERLNCFSVFLIFILVSLSQNVIPQEILFYQHNSDNSLHKMGISSGGIPDQTIGGFVNGRGGVGVDAIRENIYYANGNNTIHRMGFDGSNDVSLGGFIADGGIAVDARRGKVYYIHGTGSIHMMNLDGSNDISLGKDVNSSGDLVVDAINQKIYYTHGSDNSIHKMELDGINDQKVGGSISGLGGVTVDVLNSFIYYANMDYTIHRMELDGSNDVTIGGVTGAGGMVVDVENGMLYYSNGDNTIHRRNLINWNDLSVANGKGGITLTSFEASLPVELSSFDAISTNGAIKLKWIVESEVENSFFLIEKGSNRKEFNFFVEIKSLGNTTSRREYSYIDKNVNEGFVYNYRLSSVDIWGNIEKQKTIKATFLNNVIPEKFYISNYPNPFNSSTLIKFDLPTDSEVDISIFNNKGEFVELLLKEFKYQGSYQINWTPVNQATGLYFASVVIDNKHEFIKLAYIK